MPHNSLQVRLLKSYLNDFCHDFQPKLFTLRKIGFTHEDQWTIKSMSSLTRLWLKAHKEAGPATGLSLVESNQNRSTIMTLTTQDTKRRSAPVSAPDTSIREMHKFFRLLQRTESHCETCDRCNLTFRHHSSANRTIHIIITGQST